MARPGAVSRDRSAKPRAASEPTRTPPSPAGARSLQLDRLIHDRDRAEALWNFRYRLEMYVPKAKREYGYYVLPILRGDRLIGRIEPALDRKTGVLQVNGIWWQDDAKPVSVQKPLNDLAAFVGAKRIGQPKAAL